MRTLLFHFVAVFALAGVLASQSQGNYQAANDVTDATIAEFDFNQNPTGCTKVWVNGVDKTNDVSIQISGTKVKITGLPPLAVGAIVKIRITWGGTTPTLQGASFSIPPFEE